MSNALKEAEQFVEFCGRVVNHARYELARVTEGVALAKAPEGVEPLLRELAAATEDRDGWWRRWPNEPARHEDKSDACREDWGRALRRHEGAVEKLTRFAKVLPECTHPAAAVGICAHCGKDLGS